MGLSTHTHTRSSPPTRAIKPPCASFLNSSKYRFARAISARNSARGWEHSAKNSIQPRDEPLCQGTRVHAQRDARPGRISDERSDGPHDTYAAHSHSYDKVIYVVRGSIMFGLPELGQSLELNAGDRLDLPAGIVHNATVGAQGVVCLEAQGKSIQGNT